MSRKVWNLIVVVGLSITVQRASGGVIYVDAGATGLVHDGTGWCRAYADLQEGLAAAVAGDAIRVAGGVYRPDGGTGDRWATFRLKDRVVLLGGYAGCGAAGPDERDLTVYETILSGDLNGDDGPDFANYADNSLHVVTYDDPNATGVVLDGFTVTSGNADGDDALTNQGGGIHIRQGTIRCLPGGPTIRNCVIERNWAAHHGAVNDHAAATVIENCAFRDNFAGEQGGGLLIHHGTATVVRACTFERNVTPNEGGGMWVGQDFSCVGSVAPAFSACRFVQNRGHRGGGVWLDTGPDSEVVFTDCEFSGNVAVQLGGGVFSGGHVRVIRGRFEGNQADVYGGGLWYGGITVVTDSTFLHNEAGALGAGLYGYFSDLELSRSSLIQNRISGTAGGSGGAGLFMYGGSGTIGNSWFIGNSASTHGSSAGGGGILVLDGVVAITNCAFLGNVASQGGGALFTNGSEADLSNCTFAENFALRYGDGIRKWDSSLTLVNSILWDDQADSSGTELYITRPVSVRVEYNCIKGGWSGTGNFAADPRFLDADGSDNVPGTVDDDVRLRADSPCADAGHNASLPADTGDLDDDGDTSELLPLDLAGNPRIVGGVVDLGALERGDCNNNGVDDADDIANGTSTDCDGNGEPDECDRDCNDNGVADGCDPDRDGDGTIDDCDLCPDDGGKASPGQCGCGVADDDADGDTVADCNDLCPGYDDRVDCDNDGVPDGCELDGDGDGVIDDCDGCPSDPAKVQPGVCGCGVPDADSDGDSVLDCVDACEGFDDFADADGDGVPDGCDPCDATLDCNHNGYADACEVADGIAEDQDNNGVPDECDIMPSLTPEGCRALAVTPAAGAAPVALRVSLLGDDCLSGYLGADGLLVSSPVFRTPDQWSTVVLAGPEIVPSTQYAVEAAFGDGAVSAAARAATARWGDVMGMSAGSPPDGQVNVVDITAVINCFRNLPTAPPLHRCDLQPAVPDGVVNVTDVTAAVDGFRGLPYPHGGPCP